MSSSLFPAAVEAIHKGNLVYLEKLLVDDPALVSQRFDDPKEGYFAHPYLLWFVADNPIRHNKLPSNIVDITGLLIKFVKQYNRESLQEQVDYTLALVATGRIPKECGVQIPLMEILITEGGASVRGSVLGSIGQHNFEAALFLLDKGADYNVGTAVGLGKMDDVKRLIKNADSSELYVALVVASFFGKTAMIRLLIENGVNVNGSGSKEDFGGFHSHASALHQAVYSGSLESVKLLIDAGANINVTDKIYNGTPLGWSIYMQAEEAPTPEAKSKFAEIEAFIKARG